MRKLFWPLQLMCLGVINVIVFSSTLSTGAYTHYYGAIAYSMSKSFSNFFFGAIDPLGAISLDKIPGSFWLPAILIHLFGFSIWTINFPNVIAFGASSVLLAHTVKTLSNQVTGLIAGIILTCTPVLAAVAQSNQPELAFVFSVTLVIFFASKALANQSLKFLIFAGLAIALAFQSYMLEAWTIWLAIIVAYLMLKKPWAKKLVDLVIAGSISLMASLAWIITVSFVPASNRPYIGSTLHNSPWEMVFGYNGLGRFSASHDAALFRSIAPAFAGPPGLSRLFNFFVAGEIFWLVPVAAIAVAVLIYLKKFSPMVAMMTTWFITLFLMYSEVAGMHQFYTSTLALPIAVLVSLAIFHALEANKFWALYIVVATAAGLAVFISKKYPGYFDTVPKLQFIFVASLALFFIPQLRRFRIGKSIMHLVMIVALLATPAVWAFETRFNPSNFNPVAGPKSVRESLPKQSVHSVTNPGTEIAIPSEKIVPDSPAVLKSLRDFGFAHRGDSKYLYAMFTAIDASYWINDTGEPILPIGGFNGSDNAPTLSQFKTMVANNTVRLVLDSTTSDAFARKEVAKYLSPTNSMFQILDFVVQNCSKVSEVGQPWAKTRDIYDCSKRP